MDEISGSVWGTWVRHYPAAGIKKRPLEIRRAIFGITTEIIDGGSSNVVTKGEFTICTLARLGKEGVEHCTGRGYSTARTIWHAARHRCIHLCIKLARLIGVLVVGLPIGRTHRPKTIP